MYAIPTSNATRVNLSVPAIRRGLEGEATIASAIAFPRTVAPGRTIFCKGEPSGDIYEVVRGTIKIFKLMADGRRQIAGFLSTGHLLGLAHDECYLYSAEAVTEVVLSCYPRAQFYRLIEQFPDFARRLLVATCDELRAAQDQIMMLGHMQALEKVAFFLLDMYRRQADDAECDETISLPMSRPDIADYLGMSPATISRMLTQIKLEGAIYMVSPTRIMILDRERLEQIAKGENMASAA